MVRLGYPGHKVATFAHHISCHISQKEGKYSGKQKWGNGQKIERKKKKKKKDQRINNISDTGAHPRRNFHSICSLKHFLSGSDDLGSRVKTGFLNP